MTWNGKIEMDQNPAAKSTKSKGSVNLWRMAFIDEIVRKAESQASVGIQAVSRKSPTIVPQVAGSPSTAYIEIQNQFGGSEQSL